jgi:TPR repeat protein
VMYRNGEGVTQDYQEALKWYRLAAEQGYATAQNNLGVMYVMGKGVTKTMFAHACGSILLLAKGKKWQKRIEKR